MSEVTPTQPRLTPMACPPPLPGFTASGTTHRGLARTSNEDAVRVEPSLGLAVVADGVSGSAGGGIASRTTVDTFCEVLLAGGPVSGESAGSASEVAARRLAGAMTAAHGRMRELATSTGFQKMATTVTALWCTGGYAVVVHIGDSRAYRLRSGRLAQLTRDHTMVEDYRRRHGEVPPEIAGRYSHILSRALSARNESFEADVWIEPLEDGDVFVLCTDGLTLGVPDDEIAAVAGNCEPSAATRFLVDMANAGSGYDNVAVAVVAWRRAPPPETAQRGIDNHGERSEVPQ